MVAVAAVTTGVAVAAVGEVGDVEEEAGEAAVVVGRAAGSACPVRNGVARAVAEAQNSNCLVARAEAR